MPRARDGAIAGCASDLPEFGTAHMTQDEARRHANAIEQHYLGVGLTTLELVRALRRHAALLRALDPKVSALLAERAAAHAVGKACE